ncbi:hypothetical protein ACN27F_06820 [Solwaraspora sp. WMMB335]|uniref:hypothetical protein n=1 Tax=Solwaraspora sp. WMMB335 TaxID=3404118 RepID=UPI003B94C899
MDLSPSAYGAGRDPVGRQRGRGQLAVHLGHAGEHAAPLEQLARFTEQPAGGVPVPASELGTAERVPGRLARRASARKWAATALNSRWSIIRSGSRSGWCPVLIIHAYFLGCCSWCVGFNQIRLNERGVLIFLANVVISRN